MALLRELAMVFLVAPGALGNRQMLPTMAFPEELDQVGAATPGLFPEGRCTVPPGGCPQLPGRGRLVIDSSSPSGGSKRGLACFNSSRQVSSTPARSPSPPGDLPELAPLVR